MATCNLTDIIFDTECIGDSLLTINTNFKSLDAGLCELGRDLLDLEAFVKSLSAKDSPTVDMSFSSIGYFLSSDVRDNSLGTVKLGVDIPQTTKVFLTAAKISSLTDVSINAPAAGQALVWSGNRWTNQTLVDEVGAKIINELQDVDLVPPLQEGQVLKYRASTGKWYNGPDAGLLRVPDDNYVDITVSNNGDDWNINPGVVNTLELATNAVTRDKIANNAIVNNKIANETIGIEKIDFEIGEVNTGNNIGEGTGLYVENDAQKRLVFRTLRGTGAVSIVESGDTLEVRGIVPEAPISPEGENVGSGEGVFKSASGRLLTFKRIRGGDGITITSNENEIIVNAQPLTVGLSIIGVNSEGAPLSEESIVGIISQVYPLGVFPEGTICRLVLQVPTATGGTGSTTVTVPFDIKYYKKGNDFRLVEPDAVGSGGDTYTQSRSLTVTGTPAGAGISIRSTSTVRTYRIVTGPAWSRII